MVTKETLHYTEVTTWECYYCDNEYAYFDNLVEHLKRWHHIILKEEKK